MEKVSPRVVGSPDAIVEEVVAEFRKNIERRIAEALEAARSLLEKSYEEALRTLEKRLSESLREVEDRLRSVEATYDVEIHREISKIRASLVDEVLTEALQKLPEYVPRDQYEAFLRRLMEEAKSRSEKIKIIPVDRDKELIAKLAKELGLEVSEETRKGYGGFLAVTENGVTMDYTLENVLSAVIDRARAVIARELFPD